MPHLRMFLGEQQLDEVFIPELLLQNFTLTSVVEQEKHKLAQKHIAKIKQAQQVPSFVLEFVPSKTNNFSPLKLKK